MKLSFSSEEEVFREEVLDFLSDNLTDALRFHTSRMTSVYADKETALHWQSILNGRGWAAPSWPVEYGGCDWSVAQRYIFDVELARAGAPPLSPMGIGMCGPALIGYGTAEQKAYFLPRILSGEDFWCQGYSEPQAGSDLAALSMSAIEDGEDLICSGTKIWTTHAHEANKMFCLVRTSAAGKPQTGITFVLLDMNSSGVKVDPIIMLSGEHIQNTVFLDNVIVPKANIVGQTNDGWTVAKYLLEFERGGSSYGPRILRRLRALRQVALENDCLQPALAAQISLTEMDAMALESAELLMMTEMSAGGSPGLKASMMKVRGTELCQRVTELALELAGLYALPFQPNHTRPGGAVMGWHGFHDHVIGSESLVTFAPSYLNERAGSIYAGSNEIQRNILSKALLGFGYSVR